MLGVIVGVSLITVMRNGIMLVGLNTEWEWAVIGVVIPGAMTGIVTGIMLGVARIAGETAPLLFTALGSQFGVQGLSKPIGSLSLMIYHYALSPSGRHRHSGLRNRLGLLADRRHDQSGHE